MFVITLGMNQLLWYYADLEWIACLEDNEAGKNETMRAVSGRKSSKVGPRYIFTSAHLITFHVPDGLRKQRRGYKHRD